MLMTTWIDVKKAYDLIDHSYLLECKKKLSLPKWIEKFLETTSKKWYIELKSILKLFLKKQIRMEILHGDSLSLLLFVLCMNRLSKRLKPVNLKVIVKIRK